MATGYMVFDSYSVHLFNEVQLVHPHGLAGSRNLVEQIVLWIRADRGVLYAVCQRNSQSLDQRRIFEGQTLDFSFEHKEAKDGFSTVEIPANFTPWKIQKKYLQLYMLK
jgi:hypothetical protein